MDWTAIIDPLASAIGYMVLMAGGAALGMFLVYLPINYAWRKFGDAAALVKVVKEARRQGRPVFKWKKNIDDRPAH